VWLHNLSYKAISSLVVRENNGIHPKHKIMKYHNFFIDNIDNSSKILDIGCGNGFLAYDISKKAKYVLAIDIDKKNIRKAKKAHNNKNLTYINSDATKYNFKENFDYLILSNVLEHIQKRQLFLKSIKRLAPKILIRVPLLTRDWLTVYKKEKGCNYKLDETHYIEYTEENFQEEIKKAGLKIENYYIKWGKLYAICKK
jgi:2-polyprenyl-3-methyl-5-hydroxy-6-metoxy-1,4-benzoquinol methylase